MAQPLLIDEHGQVPLPWLREPLAQVLATQRGHALLLHAAPGIGALGFALALAQSWLCEAPAAGGLACGRCGSCRLVAGRVHPDLFVLLTEARRVELDWPLVDDKPMSESESSRRKPSRQIRIDEIRSAIDWSTRTASRGAVKVLVLHPAEALNTASANALLKTLEEPPAGTRIVLSCADPMRILPTVRSRCQRVALAAPAAGDATAWLTGQGVARPEVLLAAAAGRPLEAAEMAAQGLDAAAWASLPRALVAGSPVLAGWPVPRAVDTLLKLAHDAMAVAAGGAPRYFPAESVPRGASIAALGAFVRDLHHVARHAEHPWNEPLMADALVARARRAFAVPRAGAPAGVDPASNSTPKSGQSSRLPPSGLATLGS